MEREGGKSVAGVTTLANLSCVAAEVVPEVAVCC